MDDDWGVARHDETDTCHFCCTSMDPATCELGIPTMSRPPRRSRSVLWSESMVSSGDWQCHVYHPPVITINGRYMLVSTCTNHYYIGLVCYCFTTLPTYHDINHDISWPWARNWRRSAETSWDIPRHSDPAVGEDYALARELCAKQVTKIYSQLHRMALELLESPVQNGLEWPTKTIPPKVCD